MMTRVPSAVYRTLAIVPAADPGAAGPPAAARPADSMTCPTDGSVTTPR